MIQPQRISRWCAVTESPGNQFEADMTAAANQIEVGGKPAFETVLEGVFPAFPNVALRVVTVERPDGLTVTAVRTYKYNSLGDLRPTTFYVCSELAATKGPTSVDAMRRQHDACIERLQADSAALAAKIDHELSRYDPRYQATYRVNAQADLDETGE